MFFGSNPDKLSVYHLGITKNTIEIDFPRGIWMWVVAWHDWNGFGVHVEDAHGNIYS